MPRAAHGATESPRDPDRRGGIADRVSSLADRTPAGILIDGCFIAALGLYALFSFPFPLNPGPVEALIGALLAIFIAGSHVWAGMSRARSHLAKVERAGLPALVLGLLAYLLCAPLLAAAVNGNDPADMVRDLVPLLYLFIPALCFPLLATSVVRWGSALPWIVSGIGVAYSTRFFIISEISPLELGKRLFQDEKLYFSADPSVMYAGMFLVLTGINQVQRRRLKPVLAGLTMIAAALLPLCAQIGIVQRAPLTLFCIVIAVQVVPRFRRNPIGAFLVLIVIALFAFAFSKTITDTAALVTDKTKAVGANSKVEEFESIVATIQGSLGSSLFGLGWGGVYFSPAAGGVDVRFAHSLVGFTLLKAGICGLVVMACYLAWIFRRSWYRSGWQDPAWLAVPPTVSIGMFAQVSYKTLTYWVILLIWMAMRRKHDDEFAMSASTASPVPAPRPALQEKRPT